MKRLGCVIVFVILVYVMVTSPAVTAQFLWGLLDE